MIGDAWENLGKPSPASGGTRCGEYLENGIVLVGAAEPPDINGWFKSTDYGNTWTYKGQFPASAGAHWIEDFESRGNGRVFVGLGSTACYIKESTDWGETWTNRYSSADFIHVVKTGSLNIMFASQTFANKAYLKGSEDGGATWLAYSSLIDANGIHSWTMLHVTGKIVLAGVSLFDTSKIYRNTNNGKDGFWTQVKAFATKELYGLCKGANGVIVCANLNRFWRSTDGGLTWSDQGAPGPIADWIRDIIYCGGNIFIAVCENGRACRSIDNGVTWEDLGIITEDPGGEHLYWVIYIPDYIPPTGETRSRPCCLAGALSGSANIYRSFGPFFPEARSPTDLLCEQKKNPTNVTDPNPEFSAVHRYE